MGSMDSKDEIGGVSLIGVTQFCDALHRATLHGSRDDQSAEGEEIWGLLEAIRHRFPVGSASLIEIPRKTVEEVMTTVEGLIQRGNVRYGSGGLEELRKRLTASGVPKEIAE